MIMTTVFIEESGLDKNEGPLITLARHYRLCAKHTPPALEQRMRFME